MPHILKNSNLEIHIDLPQEKYTFSRFDWTGKIVKVIFQNISVSGSEKTGFDKENHYGKGFYNEFGIDAPVGYDETPAGGWFHKIGVGLLKKQDEHYSFDKAYAIKPSGFRVITKPDSVYIHCDSVAANGYAYVLKKKIELFESSFVIRYFLQNTGSKPIVTNEYNHNFIAINEEGLGNNYLLKFPFQLKPERFWEAINPGQQVDIRQKEVRFNGTPRKEFFFSNLSGGETVAAGWELLNRKSGIGISEAGSFKTSRVNIWGGKHVISPELFFNFAIDSGQSVEWSRTYMVYRLTH